MLSEARVLIDDDVIIQNVFYKPPTSSDQGTCIVYMFLL